MIRVVMKIVNRALAHAVSRRVEQLRTSVRFVEDRVNDLEARLLDVHANIHARSRR